ncbi:MAG: Rrf2 family transcriptional regulator [Gemmatimonadota bacterium]
MKLSKRTQYALRALADLATRSGDGPVGAEQLANHHGMPAKYLEQILLALTNAGLLNSRRGAGGGYSLAREPGMISLGEVIRTIEGDVVLLDCVDGASPAECTCGHRPTCGLARVVGDLSGAIGQLLAGATLADVCDRTEALRDAVASNPRYSI